MNTTIKLKASDPAVKLLVPKAFPDYKGRKFRLEIHQTGGMDLASNWCEGSRDYFEVVRLDNMATLAVPANGTNYTRGSNAAVGEIQRSLPAPNVAVIERSIFQGKEVGVTIHIHEDNAVKMISGVE